MLPLDIQWENLHQILRTLYEKMMPLCDKLTGLACGIAGLGALLYIGYRVWVSLAQAEPIDVFPLLRPFAIAICITFFQPFVIGGLRGILEPVVDGTHDIMQEQIFELRQHQKMKDKLEWENLERYQNTDYMTSNEEYEDEIEKLISIEHQLTMKNMYEHRKILDVEGWFVTGFRKFLEFLFNSASLIIDTIRCFYLTTLSILGPLAFAVAVYDGFQSGLVQWIGKFVSVYLWLPISDIFGAMLARIQVLSLEKDMELMTTDPSYMFDANNMAYLLFLLIGFVGYFSIPSIASWVVHATGFGTYNRKISAFGNMLAGAAGAATGKVGGAVAGKLFGKSKK